MFFNRSINQLLNYIFILLFFFFYFFKRLVERNKKKLFIVCAQIEVLLKLGALELKARTGEQKVTLIDRALDFL